MSNVVVGLLPSSRLCICIVQACICPPFRTSRSRSSFLAIPRAVLITNLVFIGAQHLYLMDLSAENLPDLKLTIERSYPDVKVSCEVESQFHQLMNLYRLQQFRPMLRTMLR